MVSNAQFFRKATEAEKSEYIEVTGKKGDSILNVFSSKLAAVQQKYTKAFRPFDTFGARMDFEAKIREKTGDSSTMSQSADNFKFNVDLESYGDASKFNYMGSVETIADKLLDGIRQPSVIGQSYDFKGKSRGNGITIYVPKDKVPAMDKWVKDNFETKTEEVVKEVKKEVKTKEAK